MKKVIITIIILILSICGIIGFWIADNRISDEILISDSVGFPNENTTDENSIDDEMVITLKDDENNTSTDEETISSEVEQNNLQNNTVTVSEKTETREKSSTSNSESSGKINIFSSQNTNVKESTTNINKTTSNSSTIDTPTSTSSTSTPSTTQTTSAPSTSTSQSVWCFEGGSNHMSGNDDYEHGYYATRQEAWDALTSYMKDFSSGNYYVDQCACGKYYYYCKPD